MISIRIRTNADIGSPCVPVVITTTRSGGMLFIFSNGMRRLQSERRYPSCNAIFTLFSIDRPVYKYLPVLPSSSIYHLLDARD